MMKVRLLATATALSLGLATGAFAQGMQPPPGGIEPGMGDDGGQGAMGQDQRPMKRTGKKKMKSMKAAPKAMRGQARGSRGAAPDGGMDSGAPDDGM